MTEFLDRLRNRRRARLRGRGGRVRPARHPATAREVARKRADAGDLGRGPGGRQRLPEAPVHDHRRRRRGRRDPADPAAERRDRDRLRDRGRPLGLRRVHRHEPLGPRQRPGRRGGPRRHPARARHRLQGRFGHRPAGRRPRAARGRRLLRRAADLHRPLRQGVRRRPRRARLRRLADLGLRPTRRRHLHQGRRRRRRPGRQDRGRDPRGRPAQPGGDRGQRRRQRRRLRRDGGGPVRDLRGHRRRGDAAGRDHLHRLHPRGGDLSARDRRRRDHRLDHRRALGPHPHGERRSGAVPRPDRLGRALGRCLLSDHQVADGRSARQRCDRQHHRRPTSGSAG